MSRDFWLAFLFFFNALWVLVELACGMIWMPIFNILAAIYILDVILDFDAWGLEDLKRAKHCLITMKSQSVLKRASRL